LFSRRDVERNPLLVEHLNAGGAEIDPARIRILRNHRVGGAEISAAVFAVQLGRRKA
jgi:hypothetical protein